MTKVLIAGYYGAGNLGDELILSGLLESLGKAKLSATALSCDPTSTSMQHRIPAVPWSDVGAVVEAMLDSDKVVVGGGGLFHDYGGFFLNRILNWPGYGLEALLSVGLAAQMAGKDTCVAAVGVGPLQSNVARELVKRFIESSSWATVRDTESLSRLLEMGVSRRKVRLAADAAFLHGEAVRSHANDRSTLPPESDAGPLKLGLALRNWWFGPSRSAWIEGVAGGVSRFVSAQAGSAVFVPMQTGGNPAAQDALVAEQVSKRMQADIPRTLVPALQDASQLANLVSSMDTIVAMRLHAILFAALSGIPIVALAYDPKVAALMRELDSSRYVVRLEDVTALRIREALDEAWSERDAYRDRLLTHTRRLRNRSSVTKDLLLSMSGSIPEAMQDPGRVAHSAGVDDMEGNAGKTTENDRSRGQRQDWSIEELRWRIVHSVSDVVQAGFTGASVRPLARSAESGAPAREAVGVKSIAGLAAALASHPGPRGAIIFSPSVDWGFMVQRPQQLARALSAKGFLVFFCTTNQTVDYVRGVQKVAESIYLCNLPAESLAGIPDPIVYIGSPWNVAFLDVFADARILYDVFDEQSVFGADSHWHDTILQRADGVIASSQGLLSSLMRARSDTVLLPNAVDLDAVKAVKSDLKHEARPAASSLGRGRSPVILYMGALARWVDYELLRLVATRRPDAEVLLVGVDLDGSVHGSGILSEPNVEWRGALTHTEAIRIALCSQVGLIPFGVSELTKATSPVKLFEYMACGIPIVTTDLPECRGYEAVSVATGTHEFMSMVDSAIEKSGDAEIRRALQRQAKANTWNVRVDTLLSHPVVGGILLGNTDDEGTGSHSRHATYRRALEQAILTVATLRASDWARRQELLSYQERFARLEKQFIRQREAVEEVLSREREVNAADRDRLQELHRVETTRLQDQVRQLQGEVGQVLRERGELSRELRALRGTLGVQLVSRYWRQANALLPEGSRRRFVYGLASAALRRLRFRMAASPGRGKLEDLLAAPWGAMSQPSGAPRHAVAGEERLRGDLLNFSARASEDGNHAVTVMVSTTSLAPNEGQRLTHLALEFARLGRNVAFLYWRWDRNTWLPQDRLADGILQVPLDYALSHPSQFFSDLAASDVALHLGFPYPGLFRWVSLAHASGWGVVYDVIDDWKAFRSVGMAPWYDPMYEEHLLRTSDLVTAVSEVLVQRVRDTCDREAVLVPNGCSPEIAEIAGAIDLLRGKITIGYFGHLTSAWFDWDLVLRAARSRPEWIFHLIGFGDEAKHGALPGNVCRVGPIPQGQLAAYAANWDVAMVPFRAGPVSNAADPIKVYEYLAMGLPVVATAIHAPRGAEDLVLSASSLEEFLIQIEVAKNTSSDLVKQRKRFAAGATWAHRAQDHIGLLRSRQGRLAEKAALCTEGE